MNISFFFFFLSLFSPPELLSEPALQNCRNRRWSAAKAMHIHLFIFRKHGSLFAAQSDAWTQGIKLKHTRPFCREIFSDRKPTQGFQKIPQNDGPVPSQSSNCTGGWEWGGGILHQVRYYAFTLKCFINVKRKLHKDCSDTSDPVM